MDKQWTPQRVIDRVLANIDISPNGCHVSRYSGPNGYAQVYFREAGKLHARRAHRVVWVHFNGRIPAGFTVDHIRGVCSTRKCINPEHLRLLTISENSSDNGNRTKTHCPKGHPYSGDNLRLGVSRSTANRICRTCQREHKLAYKERGLFDAR